MGPELPRSPTKNVPPKKRAKNVIKVDTSLLRKVDVNQANLELLSSLIAQLHERQISVIAPMLEQLPILPLLWQANVDFMQGHCLHQPSPALNFEFIETRTVCLAVAKQASLNNLIGDARRYCYS